MSLKKRLYWAGGTVAVLALAAIAVLSTRGTGSTEPDRESPRPVAVEVRPVSRATITERISAVGTVAAMQDVIVSAETAGRVVRVAVQVGDVVREGQLLVQLDDELKNVAVDQARAQALAAETTVSKAGKDHARAATLFQSGDIADVEMEAYTLALHASQAQYQAARAGLRLAERQLADTRVKAPISGIVASRKVDPGEMVAPGMEIANIVQISTVKVKLSIQEEEIGKLRTGMEAIVRIDPRPGESFHGRILTIGAKSETPTGHTYPVEVILRNSGKNLLRAGMFARVDISCASVHRVLAVPKESLVGTGTPAVFVVDAGTAHYRSVSLGLRDDALCEVTGGLKEGDLVVSFGQKNLKDGAAVVTVPSAHEKPGERP